MKLTLLLCIVFFMFSHIGYAQPVDIVIQTGHTAPVKHIAWSNDGKYIASAGEDGSIKLWDAKLRLEIFNWFPFSKWSSYVAFSRDNHYLLATGSTENVLFDLTNGKKISTVICDWDTDEGSETGQAVFSDDGKYVFADRSSKEASRIIRWELKEMINPIAYTDMDLNTDNEERPIVSQPKTAVYYEGRGVNINSIQVSHNGKYLIGAEDSAILIWDIATTKLTRSIRIQNEIKFILISADDAFVYSLDGSALRQWNIATGKQNWFLPVTGGARCMATSPDGKKLAIGNYLKEITTCNTVTKKIIHVLKGHSDYLNALAFNEDGSILSSAGEDKTIKIWDVNQGKMLSDLKSEVPPVEKLVYNNEHNIISTLSTDNGVNRIISWETGNGIGVKSGHHGKPKLMINNPFYMDTAGTFVLATEDSSLVMRQPVTGKLIKRIYFPFISALVMSDDGKMIIVQNGKDGNFYKCMAPSFEPVFFTAHPSGKAGNVHTMDISNDGKWLVAGDIGADMYVWNIETGEYLRNLNYLDADSSRRKSNDYDEYDLDVSNAWVYDAKFSPDGKLIAAACRMPDPIVTGGLIIVWDIATGELIHWVSAHIYPIQSINWSPDGKYIITGSNDKRVRVWEYSTLKEGEPVYTYSHGYTAMHTSFTADQQWIISGGIDGNVIIKRADDFKTLATLISLDTADYVAVTPEQYYAASKEGVKLISFRQGMKILPAVQFDLRYNRPDKVLEALGSKDTTLIRSYKRAYDKRMKKLGIDTTSFTNTLSRPEASIKGADTMKYNRTESSLLVHISANGLGFLLDRFNVWVNDVPVYGQRGVSLKHRQATKWDSILVIRLSQGENRIEISVTDVNGTESYRQPLLLQYLAPKIVQPKLHFIGIGINHFKDSRYDLSWSVKDIRDLAVKLRSKYNDAIIDTLFDENVTRENILALKTKLSALNENDKVIISYSGHGVFSKDFDYYLSTYAMNFENPGIDGLNYEDLESLVDSIRPRQKLLLIDACHSGEIDRDDVTYGTSDSLPSGIKGVSIGVRQKRKVGIENSFELMQNLFVNVSKGTGATIISAAGGTQYALERGDLRNGVFTYSILEAMANNKSLKVSDLKKMVGERVKELTEGRQVPTSRNETSNYDWVVW